MECPGALEWNVPEATRDVSFLLVKVPPNGMSREATRGLGGWKTPGLIENVYGNARSGEGVPQERTFGLTGIAACWAP